MSYLMHIIHNVKCQIKTDTPHPSYQLIGLLLTLACIVSIGSAMHLHNADFQVKLKISRIAGHKFAKLQPAEKFHIFISQCDVRATRRH